MLVLLLLAQVKWVSCVVNFCSYNTEAYGMLQVPVHPVFPFAVENAQTALRDRGYDPVALNMTPEHITYSAIPDYSQRRLAHTYGQYDATFRSADETMRQENVDVMIAGVSECDWLATTAAVERQFLATYACRDLKERESYPTTILFQPTLRDQLHVLASLLRANNFSSVVVLYADYIGELPPFAVRETDAGLAEMARTVFKENRITVTQVLGLNLAYSQERRFLNTENYPCQMNNLADVVRTTFMTTRVYIAFGKPAFNTVASLLVTVLNRFGLMQTGEYLIINVMEPSGYATLVSSPNQFTGYNMRSFYQGDKIQELPDYSIPGDRPVAYFVENHIENGLAAKNVFFMVPTLEDSNRDTLKSQIMQNEISKEASIDPTVFQEKYKYSSSERRVVQRSVLPRAGYFFLFYLFHDLVVATLLAIADARSKAIELTAANLRDKFEGTKYPGYMKDNEFDQFGSLKATYTLLKLEFNSTLMARSPVVDLFSNGTKDFLNPEFYANLEWITEMPKNEPECGFLADKCPVKTPDQTWIALAVSLAALLFLLGFGANLAYKLYKKEQDLLNLQWLIEKYDIRIKNFQDLGASKRSLSVHSLGSTLSVMDLQTFEKNLVDHAKVPDTEQEKMDEKEAWLKFEGTAAGAYNNGLVWLQEVNKTNVFVSRDVRIELKSLKDMNNENLVKFFGCVYDPPLIVIVQDYCSRGPLLDIIDNDTIVMDNIFHASIVYDIMRGMDALMQSPIKFHGRLRSSNCMVDKRWQVKLSDFGLWEFRHGEENRLSAEQMYRDLLWTAPEILRAMDEDDASTAVRGNVQGDVYSFGIIVHELYGNHGTFGMDFLDPEEAIMKLKNPPAGGGFFRPDMDIVNEAPDVVKKTIRLCLAEEPKQRPTFGALKRMLAPIKKGLKPNIMDNIVELMERYTNNLEDVVKEKTIMLTIEKRKTERLLLNLLPDPVADTLKKGEAVAAESFDMVTIYFSDIVGFTKLSSRSNPIQIMTFLNDLYVMFDTVANIYSVYKVETIGDAYVCVSGLPSRIGDNHYGEVGSLALALLEAIEIFQVRHLPDYKLLLRIGLHSGPCVAGVVGVRMPRYCLFGHAVHTAEEMESGGKAMAVHISEQCKEGLDKLGGYETEERNRAEEGQEVDDEHPEATYWLQNEDKDVRRHRLKEEAVHYPVLKRLVY